MLPIHIAPATGAPAAAKTASCVAGRSGGPWRVLWDKGRGLGPRKTLACIEQASCQFWDEEASPTAPTRTIIRTCTKLNQKRRAWWIFCVWARRAPCRQGRLRRLRPLCRCPRRRARRGRWRMLRSRSQPGIASPGGREQAQKDTLMFALGRRKSVWPVGEAPTKGHSHLCTGEEEE